LSRRVNIKEGAPSSAVSDILYQNIIGTPGKSLVYQHLKTKEKISKLGKSTFLSLELGGRPVGACCFIDCEVSVASKKIKVYYTIFFIQTSISVLVERKIQDSQKRRRDKR
jgi:hypothetical protein